LEEAADELLGVEGAGPEGAGVGGAIAEGDLAVGQFEDAAVADGDAEDVGSQILQGVETIAHGLAMNDPILLPHCWGDKGEEIGLAQSVAELGAEDGGEGLDGKQEVLSGGQPGLTIRGKAASGDEVVNVGVVAEVAPPGMEDADEADLPADEARVLGQVLEGGGRSAEEEVVEGFLVAANDVPELAGQGEGEEKVWGREQEVLLLLQPPLGLVVLALGTMPVAAGVIEILDLVTHRAVIDVSPQGRRTAALDGAHGLEMPDGHTGAKTGAILGTVMVEDGGHLYHSRSSVM
jgi:hypothetical protein